LFLGVYLLSDYILAMRDNHNWYEALFYLSVFLLVDTILLIVSIFSLKRDTGWQKIIAKVGLKSINVWNRVNELFAKVCQLN